MRAAVVGFHDRLHLMEVRLVLELVVDVNGDVSGLATVRGAQRHIVGRDHAYLDWEADQQALALDHGADVAHRRHEL